MSETKLLPCPFCGGEAEWTTRKKQWIRCKNCGVESTFCEKTEEAIEAWNTRKPMERIMERLEVELSFADDVKEYCARANPLQFDSAKGYSNGIYNSIYIVKEGGGL